MKEVRILLLFDQKNKLHEKTDFALKNLEKKHKE